MKILVMDIETTAIAPSEGEIVEIGGVLLDTRTGIIEPAVNMIIKPQGEFDHNAWIFQNSDLTPKMVMNGVDISVATEILNSLIGRYSTTAYNGQFDFGWLAKYGIVPKIILPDDPMYAAMYLLKIPGRYGKYKWPSVQECLDYFNIQETEPHRAAKDAELEAKIIVNLLSKNAIKIRPSLTMLHSGQDKILRLWSKIETYEHLLNTIESERESEKREEPLDIFDLFDLITEKMKYCQVALDSEVWD